MVNAALQRYSPKSDLYPVVNIDRAATLSDTYADINLSMDIKQLLVFVQSLPNAYRLVFNLYVFEGYKHREIAAMLGIVEGTSKSNLSAARLILQKAIMASGKNNIAKSASL